MQVTDKAYQEHRVFAELARCEEFYQQLAMSVFSFATMGTTAICNIDTYLYSSMQGTLHSIKTILLAGRINDGYALLRKYYDSAIINAYSSLYLRNNFSLDNFVVEKINSWLQGREGLPEYRVMSMYLKKSETLKPINDVLDGEKYKRLRNRCNDHTHYNLYRYAMLNDNEVYIRDRERWLNQISEDVQDVFVLHLGYIFFINNQYMMSSDYMDALECGLQPDDNSQYWVAPFIQRIFDEIITPRQPDITRAIKENSVMQLS